MSEPVTPPDTVIAALSQSIAGALGLSGAAPDNEKSLPDSYRGGSGLVPSGLQLLALMQPWDWQEQPYGSMPYQQFVLADSVPASVLPDVVFTPTSASFSGGYATFLELLDPGRFPLPVQLAAGITAIAPPDVSPTADMVPEGWARSMDSTGIVRWRPAYGVSTTPAQWIADLSANPGDATTMVLPITDEPALTLVHPDGQRRTVSLQDTAEQAMIVASALGQVMVTPGSWFNDSLCQLGRDGVFRPGIAPGKTYAGMLSGRVSSLVVAYNPVLHIVPANISDDQAAAALGTASAVEIGGFSFPSPVAPPPSSGPGAIATYSARNGGAWIIGVTIEAFS